MAVTKEELVKLQKLAEEDTVTINETKYTIQQVMSHEGVRQLVVLDEKQEQPCVLAMPEDGNEGEVALITLKPHGDHFHPDKQIEIKKVEF